jgi:hypothetical protein
MALINPQTGASSSIYDPSLPSRIMQGQQLPPQQSPDTIASIAPGQGPQYNPSFGADTSPEAMGPAPPAPLLTSAPPPQNPWALPSTGAYRPSPLGAALASSVKGNYLNRSLGNVDARGAPYPAGAGAAARPSNTGPGGADVSAIFNQLPDNTFDGARNASQTAQAPASATPQGWNLFAALGQALSHLLGFNAQGQPQGMSGLIRNPVQPAPTQTANLRMPTPVQQASRYQGRTLIG